MIALDITQKVMLGTAILGGVAGVVGSFAVLRRRALVGDMLSHAALPGICLAFVLAGNRNIFALSLGALATGMLGILAITVITRYTRTKEDAAIGIVLSTFFGAGVVLMALIQKRGSGNRAGLDSYIFGETASIQSQDILVLSVTGCVALLLVVALFKEFQALSFDPDFASAQGWPTTLLDLIMMGALAIVTIIGLPIVGVILMAAMIILPGATARFWTDRLGTLLIVAGVVGAAAGVLGTLLASPHLEQWLGFDPLEFGPRQRTLPPGPLIVLSASAIFVASVLLAPGRGVLARSWAEFQLRRRIGRDHLLRAFYELNEPLLPARQPVALSDLMAHRSWHTWVLRWSLWHARRNGWIEQVAEGLRLTPAGLQAAARVTRTHRLWELYLVEYANIAADHVDRDADDVEHLLPDRLVSQLEQRLADAGRLPAADVTVPQSPHMLGDG